MIKAISISNFKSLKLAKLPIKNLNLFTGLNGMGKSSFIQAILLLRQSFQQGMLEDQGLTLKGSLIELGTGKDVFNQYAGKDENIEIKINTEEFNLYWTFGYLPDADILPIERKTSYTEVLKTCGIFNKDFQYLNAEHIIPQTTYKKSEFEVIQNKQIGKYGEYAVHYLSVYGLDNLENENLIHEKSKSKILIHNIDAWLNEISPGVKLIVEDIKGVDLVRLGFQYETESGYTNEFKPINVGYGLTYALPVILTLLTAKKGKIIIIENPESHLHPKGQAKIGELAALAAEMGAQIFIETHSDHILNGVRVAVKEKKINPLNVNIQYFERGNDAEVHESKISTIEVDRKGELSHYPKDLLEEWSNQLLKLL